MIDFLTSVFGKYTVEAYSFVLQFCYYSFISFLLMLNHKKKKLFPLRFMLSFIAGGVLSYLIAILNTWGGNNREAFSIFIRICCYTMSTLLCLALILICDNENMIEILTCWCKTIAIHQLVGKLYPLIQNILGINDRATFAIFHDETVATTDLDFFIFISFQIIFYLIFTAIFRKKRILYDDSSTAKATIALSISFVMIVNCFIVVSRLFEEESMTLTIIIKLFTILFSLTILIFFVLIDSRNKSIEDEAILQQLWKQDKQQFKA